MIFCDFYFDFKHVSCYLVDFPSRNSKGVIFWYYFYSSLSGCLIISEYSSFNFSLYKIFADFRLSISSSSILILLLRSRILSLELPIFARKIDLASRVLEIASFIFIYKSAFCWCLLWVSHSTCSNSILSCCSRSSPSTSTFSN